MLIAQMGNTKKSDDAMKIYPGGFGETLAQMMKERKLSDKTRPVFFKIERIDVK